MPRANFGGATDYTSTFAGIYRQNNSYDGGARQNRDAEYAQDARDADMLDLWQNDEVSDEEFSAYVDTRLAASTDPRDRQRWTEIQREVGRRGKERAKIQQQADDADAYDDWQNGTITDDEWLAHLANRVAQTAEDEDPREHQQWVERHRQYTRAIGDKTIERQYEQGEISAAQYIAYHEKVLAEMKPGSQAYSERKAFITAAIDREAANDLQTRSQEIMDGIDSGDASWQDLLKLYEEHQKKAKPNSDLYKTLTSEIGKVRNTIRDNAANGALERIEYLFKAGKLSGREAGKQIRNVADSYFKGDEAKYYNVLESALGFEKYGGGTIESGGSGGGGGRRRSGGGGSGGGGATKAPATTIAQLRANIARAENITDQFVTGAQTITDPVTGDTIPNDPRVIHAIQMQTLADYDSLTDIYNKAKKPKEAQNAAKAKTNFIQNKVQVLNTITKSDQAQHLIGSLMADIQTEADSSNDPLSVLRRIQTAGEELNKFLKTVTNSGASRAVPSDVMATGAASFDPTGGNVRPEEELPDAKFINEVGAWANLFTMLGDPNVPPEQAKAQLELLQKSTGKLFDDSFLNPVEAIASANKTAYVGLSTGEYVLASYESNGKTVVGPVPMRDSAVFPAMPDQPLTIGREPALDYDPSKGEKVTQIYVQMNGKPTPVWAVATPVVSPYKVWRAERQIVLVGKDGREITVPKGGIVYSSLIGSQTPNTVNSDGFVTEQGLDWETLKSAGLVKQDNYDMDWLAVVTPEHTDQGKTYRSQVYVNDPILGSWSIGRPPIASVRQNPDGTIWFDSTDGGQPAPQVQYQPSGTKYNVPIPFVGDDNKTMQAVVNQLGVGDGTYTMLDDRGNPVIAPPDYWSDAYYDPAMEALARARQKRVSTPEGSFAGWYDKAVADQKVRRAQDEAKAIERQHRASQAPEFQPTNDITAELEKFAGAMGITFGVRKEPMAQASSALPPLPSFSPHDFPTVKPSLPTIKQPVDNTASVIPAPNLSAGPRTSGPKTTLPSLPQAPAPSIPPKITAPPPSDDTRGLPPSTKPSPPPPVKKPPMNQKSPTPKASTPGRANLPNY